MYFVIENEERKMIDQAVIDRINQGDVKAFECLYNDYFVYLCACANSYIFNAEEAQDIVNEVFILKSATPFPKCYLHKEKWTFDS